MTFLIPLRLSLIDARMEENACETAEEGKEQAKYVCDQLLRSEQTTAKHQTSVWLTISV